MEKLLAQKDLEMDQKDKDLEQLYLDLDAANEGKRVAEVEVSLLTDALSTVEEQLNMLRARWKQYREDVESEVAMLDCHIDDVCSMSSLLSDTNESGGAQDSAQGSRFPLPASPSMAQTTAAVAGSPPVAVSPGFFEDDSADSSMASSLSDGDAPAAATAAIADSPEREAQLALPPSPEQHEPEQAEETDATAALLALRSKMQEVASEIGAQRGAEAEEMANIRGVIEECERVPEPPETHEIASFNTTASSVGMESLGVSMVPHAPSALESAASTTAQVGMDDGISAPASPRSPEAIGSGNEPAGTPPDESIGFTEAAEALRAEMEASISRSAASADAEVNQTVIGVVAAESSSESQGKEKLVEEEPRSFRPVMPRVSKADRSTVGREKDTGSISLQEQLATSRREKEMMMEKVAHMEKKYEKVKDAYVRQSKMSASVNQALVSNSQQFQAHSTKPAQTSLTKVFRCFVAACVRGAERSVQRRFIDHIRRADAMAEKT